MNDYIVDKIFKDYVETLGVSSTILEEDPSVIKNIFKNGTVSSEKNKLLVCIIMSGLAYADTATFYITLNTWKQSLMDFKLYSSVNQDIAYSTYSFKDTVIFAFKGSSNIKDFFYDINISLINTVEVKGRIHEGFYKLLMKNRTLYSISRLIENYSPDVKIIFTGHSLGGALASLMASYSQYKFGNHRVELCTFGSPRVGNSKFCNTITGATRVVHSKDPVALLPLPIRYRHLKTRKLIGETDIFRWYVPAAHKISSYYNLISES